MPHTGWATMHMLRFFKLSVNSDGLIHDVELARMHPSSARRSSYMCTRQKKSKIERELFAGYVYKGKMIRVSLQSLMNKQYAIHSDSVLVLGYP